MTSESDLIIPDPFCSRPFPHGRTAASPKVVTYVER
jgi:hypothetical protein